jgi:hypothetical protein
LENEINWKEHTVWVEDSELPRIGDRVLAFHNRIDPEEFHNLQRRNRQLWENRLQPEPYFRHVLETVAKGGKAP